MLSYIATQPVLFICPDAEISLWCIWIPEKQQLRAPVLVWLGAGAPKSWCVIVRCPYSFKWCRGLRVCTCCLILPRGDVKWDTSLISWVNPCEWVVGSQTSTCARGSGPLFLLISLFCILLFFVPIWSAPLSLCIFGILLFWRLCLLSCYVLLYSSLFIDCCFCFGLINEVAIATETGVIVRGFIASSLRLL